MDDSEKNEPEQPDTQAPAVRDIIVKRASGALIPRRVDSQGKFLKTERPMPEAKEITRMMRKLMLLPRKGDPKALSRFREMFDNIMDIATADSKMPVMDKMGHPIVVDGKPLLIRDAKMAMASVKAAQLLFERTYGRLSPSDDEIEAQKISGVKIVVINSPELMHPETVPEVQKEKLKPSFIDADFREIET